MNITKKIRSYLSPSKHPKPFTYVAVRQPRTISWYATEIITVEAALIAVGAFLLGGAVASHDYTYVVTESHDGDINKIMAITTYLACLFLATCLLALRFYKFYKGLPVLLAIAALLLCVFGYVEFDSALMNTHSVEYDPGI